MTEHEHVRVAVIGSGFGGLGAAVRLRREGVTDFVVLERADSVGGTWRDNSYPGCACDVPSTFTPSRSRPTPTGLAPSPGRSTSAPIWSTSPTSSGSGRTFGSTRR